MALTFFRGAPVAVPPQTNEGVATTARLRRAAAPRVALARGENDEKGCGWKHKEETDAKQGALFACAHRRVPSIFRAPPVRIAMLRSVARTTSALKQLRRLPTAASAPIARGLADFHLPASSPDQMAMAEATSMPPTASTPYPPKTGMDATERALWMKRVRSAPFVATTTPIFEEDDGDMCFTPTKHVKRRFQPEQDDDGMCY